MPSSRSGRLIFCLVVCVLLLLTGRNLYRHHLESAFDLAVQGGDAETVQALLKQGIYTNRPDSMNNFLYIALRGNDPAIVHALLQVGAEANQPCSGSIPVNVAAGYCPDALPELFARGASMPPNIMIEAAQYRQVRAARLLLDRGADVNAQTSYKETALYKAALNGDMPMVQLLLDRGARIETQNQERSPLNLAASYGRLDIVRAMLRRGVSSDAQAHALTCAAYDGHSEVVKELLTRQNFAAVSPQDWRHAVDAARSRHHPDIVALLKKSQARH